MSNYVPHSRLCGLSAFDRELLLLEGISLQGLGNWQAIAEHVGTRTKEEVEQHYKSVYIDSQEWPLPVSLLDTPKRTTAYLVVFRSAWTNIST